MTLNKPTPNKINVYCYIVDFMKINASHETMKKLDILKRKIVQGFDSPSTESINVFGVNLFIFDYKDYLSMFEYSMSGGSLE